MTRNKQYIKIFGERNTGTNYLQKLINLNFHIDILPGSENKIIHGIAIRVPFGETLRDLYFQFYTPKNLGWKHKEIENIDLLKKQSRKYKDVYFLVMVKNPYSWLLSLHRNPYHTSLNKDISFHDFLRSPWKSGKRESSTNYYETPIEMWNEKVSSCLTLAKFMNTHIIKYEDLLDNPILVLKNIQDKFNLTETDSFPINYKKSTKDSTKNANYYKEYYGNEKWKANLSTNDITYINRFINKDLMSYFGYNII